MRLCGEEVDSLANFFSRFAKIWKCNKLEGEGVPKKWLKVDFSANFHSTVNRNLKMYWTGGGSTLWYMKGLAFAIWDDFNPKKLRVFEKYFQLPKISKNEPISFNFIQFLAKFWHFPLISLPLHPNLEYEFRCYSLIIRPLAIRDERVFLILCILHFVHMFRHFCAILFRGVGWGYLIPSK